MRLITDPCLLCKSNLATKTNSHIFPKFLSTGFLGEKGKPRRGYDLGSDSALDTKPKIIQDSPKESYILCDECEAYFSVLEGISQDTLINWSKRVQRHEFKISKLLPECSLVDCVTASKTIIRLLIYSMFWRADISSISLFDNLEIADDLKEELRVVLLSYKSSNSKELLNKLAQTPTFTVFPVWILTAENFNDPTANMLYVSHNQEPYAITVDKYAFVLFRGPSQIAEPAMLPLINTDINHCKITLLSADAWDKIVIKQFFSFFVEQARKNKE